MPLYAGFMYAAVGSYICQAFRRFDLRVDRFRWRPAAVLAAAAYANFFTHHYLPDQAEVWRLVHVDKWGSWALLVSLSFVLVARVKMQEGRFYGEAGVLPAVTGDR